MNSTLKNKIASGKWALGLTLVASLVACGGSPAPQVAAADVVVPLKAATVAAVEKVAFAVPAGAFPASVPALANVATTVTFTNTTSATPTATIVAPGGTVTGNTTFGSCTFTVTASTLPGVTVGQQFTVNPCQVNVQTGGLQATGLATAVHVLLQLGQVQSNRAQASVAIDPVSGVVTVNGVSGGSVTLQVSTGAK